MFYVKIETVKNLKTFQKNLKNDHSINFKKKRIKIKNIMGCIPSIDLKKNNKINDEFEYKIKKNLKIELIDENDAIKQHNTMIDALATCGFFGIDNIEDYYIKE